MTFSIHLSDQSGKFSLNTEVTPYFRISYGFGRSKEARTTEQPAEDYLAYQYSDEILAFVICDGVGQSIGADYAAYFLGGELLRYFRMFYLERNLSRKTLINYLNSSLEAAQHFISRSPNPFPPESKSFHLYEQQRADGAEVKFVAGLVDMVMDQVIILSLGDLLFAATDKSGQILPGPGSPRGDWLSMAQASEQPPKWEYPGAWSSTRGIIDPRNLEIWSEQVSNLRQISLASDGFDTIFCKTVISNSDATINDNLRKAYKIGRDDISYLQISFQKATGKRLSCVKRCKQENRTISWEPVSNADAYRVIFKTKEGGIKFTEISHEKCYAEIPNNNVISIRIQAISHQFTTSSWFEAMVPIKPAPRMSEKIKQYIILPLKMRKDNLFRLKTYSGNWQPRNYNFFENSNIFIGLVIILAVLLYALLIRTLIIWAKGAA